MIWISLNYQWGIQRIQRQENPTRLWIESNTPSWLLVLAATDGSKSVVKVPSVSASCIFFQSIKLILTRRIPSSFEHHHWSNHQVRSQNCQTHPPHLARVSSICSSKPLRIWWSSSIFRLPQSNSLRSGALGSHILLGCWANSPLGLLLVGEPASITLYNDLPWLWGHSFFRTRPRPHLPRSEWAQTDPGGLWYPPQREFLGLEAITTILFRCKSMAVIGRSVWFPQDSDPETVSQPFENRLWQKKMPKNLSGHWQFRMVDVEKMTHPAGHFLTPRSWHVPWSSTPYPWRNPTWGKSSGETSGQESDRKSPPTMFAFQITCMPPHQCGTFLAFVYVSFWHSPRWV